MNQLIKLYQAKDQKSFAFSIHFQRSIPRAQTSIPRHTNTIPRHQRRSLRAKRTKLFVATTTNPTTLFPQNE
ncbi:hypothetical protein [Flavobacterium sp.]